MAMLVYTALVGAAVFGSALPFNLHGPAPRGFVLALFVVFGLGATLGHFLFAAAFRIAPASLLAPVNCVHIAFAWLMGWVFFDHIPTAMSVAGMAHIVASGAATAFAANRRQERCGCAPSG